MKENRMTTYDDARAEIERWKDRPTITRRSHPDQIVGIERLRDLLAALASPPPDTDAVRALEAWIYHHGSPEHLLTFQGILRSHEEARAALSSPPADDVREAAEQLADWLGEQWFARNRRGYTDECTTFVEVDVEVLAESILSRFDVRLRGTVTEERTDV